MRNVTITLHEDVARWARIEAARHDTSVSRMVGEMLRRRMVEDDERETARDRFFSVAPRTLRREGSALPRRDELHDRAGLR